MKTLSFCLFLISFSLCLIVSGQDPVRNAYKENEEKIDRDLIDKDAAEFLVKATEGRLMNINEGKLAVLKGSSTEVRNYGQMMAKDESAMLDEIKKVAARANITLPEGVSDKKREGQMDLSEAAGKDFDEKFIKMMIAGLEHDIRLFEKAKSVKDSNVAMFAGKYISMLQAHLANLETIKSE